MWQKKILITWNCVGCGVFISEKIFVGPSKICHVQKIYYIIKIMHLHFLWLSINYFFFQKYKLKKTLTFLFKDFALSTWELDCVGLHNLTLVLDVLKCKHITIYHVGYGILLKCIKTMSTITWEVVDILVSMCPKSCHQIRFFSNGNIWFRC